MVVEIPGHIRFKTYFGKNTDLPWLKLERSNLWIVIRHCLFYLFKKRSDGNYRELRAPLKIGHFNFNGLQRGVHDEELQELEPGNSPRETYQPITSSTFRGCGFSDGVRAAVNFSKRPGCKPVAQIEGGNSG